MRTSSVLGTESIPPGLESAPEPNKGKINRTGRAVWHYPTLYQINTRVLDSTPAWDGNWTWDCFICFAWKGLDGRSLIVVVNYAPNQSQCYLQIPCDGLQSKTLHLVDLMGPAKYDRPGDASRAPGLYLDLPGWGYHVFEITTLGTAEPTEPNAQISEKGARNLSTAS